MPDYTETKPSFFASLTFWQVLVPVVVLCGGGYGSFRVLQSNEDGLNNRLIVIERLQAQETTDIAAIKTDIQWLKQDDQAEVAKQQPQRK